jgi:dipeptidyl aminopeptidase/acylaminoacyl peptidase
MNWRDSMTDLRPVLEQLRDRISAPPGGIERLIRFRERKRRRQRLAIIGTALIIGVAGTLVAVRAFAPYDDRLKPAAPLPHGVISFVRGMVLAGPLIPDAEIYVMEPDGSGVRKLTDAAAEGKVAAEPDWSPDGMRIAFVLSTPEHLGAYAGDGDVYVMNADATGVTKLTDGLRAAHPAWSPDGTRLAFVRDQGSSLVVMNADGSHVREVRVHGKAFPPYQWPAWSPDGTRIAFQASPSKGVDTNGVYVTNLDGQETMRVSPGLSDGYPAWSPDGTTLAYASSGGIFLHDMQTGTNHRLTICGEQENCGFDFEPSWAPDGSRIVFARQDYGGSSVQIFVVNTDGTGVQQLTSGPQWNAYPSWRPTDSTDPSRCEFPTLRPTYLPWVHPGKEIPAPHESYDDEIDRAQLSWSDPRFPLGETGVGLTVYTHFPQGNRGQQTDIVVRGVAGRLHGPGDGGGVSVSWVLPTSTCNFLELSYGAPNLTMMEAIQQLLKIGRSLQ